MKLINFTAQPNGLRLETSQGLIDLTAYSPDIIRIRYTLEPEFSPKKSLMIVAEAQNPVEVSVQETTEALFFRPPNYPFRLTAIRWHSRTGIHMARFLPASPTGAARR